MKAIQKIKNNIQNLTSKEIKLTNYKNCLYHIKLKFKIEELTDQEYENVKNELIKILKKFYGSNHSIQIKFERLSVNLSKKNRADTAKVALSPFTILLCPADFPGSGCTPWDSCWVPKNKCPLLTVDYQGRDYTENMEIFLLQPPNFKPVQLYP